MSLLPGIMRKHVEEAVSNCGVSAYGITADLVMKQIAAESSWDKWAVGPPTRYGCAMGLMQLIPSVCVQYGVEAPFNPIANVRCGVRLLADNAKLIQSKYPQASLLEWTFASFNWGIGNVLKLLKELLLEGSPLTWQESTRVPTETVKYVKKIVG